MSVYQGRNGFLRVVAPVAAEQTGSHLTASQEDALQMASWRISGGPDIEDISEFGDSWGNHATTLKRWSGSAEGYLNAADGVGQTEIMGAVVDGWTSNLTPTSGDTEMQFNGQFYIDDSPATQSKLLLYGNVVPSFEITGSVGGIFLVSFTFQGSGALTYSAVGEVN
jgi:hypothetical protein